MAFQFSGFQRTAFQIGYYVSTAAAKLKKKLRRNTRLKARADELMEQYRRLLEKEANNAHEVVEVVKPYSRETTPEDLFKLPEIENIDFEAIARNAAVRKNFMHAVRIAISQEEEELALILTLAAI